MELQTVIDRRRMVRRFAPTPVPPELLDRVLANALRAPSAGFSQGWAFVVLEGPEQTGLFWELTVDRDNRPAKNRSIAPPVIILPLADKQAYLDRYSEPDKAGYGLDVEEGWPVPYWYLDAAMASLLMLLTATDVGLGAWFFGIFHGERELLDALGVPDGYRAVGAVGLGYPAPDDHPSGSVWRGRRPVDEVVHRGRWGSRG